MIAALPIAYFASRKNASKPQWLSSGLVIMGLGSLVCSLPHFIAPPYDALDNRGLQHSEEISTQPIMCDDTHENSTNSNDCPSSLQPWLSDLKYVFILGQFLHGIGAISIFTIGLVFIDESVSQTQSSFNLGFVYVMATVGPAIGYILGGLLLNVYIDVNRLDFDQISMDPSDDRWLGAWWIGFLISGIAAILSAIPMSMLSKVISSTADEKSLSRENKREENYTYTTSVVSVFDHLENLKSDVLGLCKNITFIFLAIGDGLEGFTVSGLASFTPKIVEVQLGMSARVAGMTVGALALSCGAAGVFLGGWVIKKFKLECKYILRLCFSICFISAFCQLGFLLYCPEVKFAGVNSFYSGEMAQKVPNLVADCNRHCNCGEASYRPICGVNEVSYFSPCHAGCSGSHYENNTKIFTDCKCIDSWSINSTRNLHDGVLQVQEALLNGCQDLCGSLVYIMFILFSLGLFLTFSLAVPNLIGVLRCVHPDKKDLAIALNSMIFRIIGSIPGPLLTGIVIDEACLLWQKSCDGERGSCVAYDNYYLSRYVLALFFTVKIAAVLSFLIAMVFYNPAVAEASGSTHEMRVENLQCQSSKKNVHDNAATEDGSPINSQATYDNLALET